MAFIPDEAVDESSTITPLAFRLYALICRRRDHSRGLAILRSESAANLLQIHPSSARRAFAELIQRAWIARNHAICIPLKGDFAPMDRYAKARNREANQSAPSGAQSAPYGAQSAPKRARTPIHHPASLSSLDNPWPPATGDRDPRTCPICGKIPCSEPMDCAATIYEGMQHD